MSRCHPDTNNRKRKRRELLFIDKDDFHVVREMLPYASFYSDKFITDQVYKAVDVREGDEERRVHSIDFTLKKLYLPNEIGNLSNLTRLLLRGCGIRRIPPSIGRLQNLEELDISNNKNLSELPDEIGDLASLIKLNLNENRSIKFLPRSIRRLRNLKELNLSSMYGLNELPEEIGELSQLNMLHMASLHELTSLPFSFGRLRNLTVLDLSSHTWFELPEVVGEFVGLTKLTFSAYKMTSLPTWIGRLQNLEDLDITCTGNLSTLPREIEGLSRLKKLNLKSSFIKSIAFIGRLGNLRELDLQRTYYLETLPEEIGDLSRLKKLNLRKSRILSLPPSIGRLGNLRELDLSRMVCLEKLPEEIGQLTNLEELDLTSSSITSLPDSIGRLASLRCLTLVGVRIPELRGDDAEAFVLKLAQRCPQLRTFQHNAALKNKIPDFAFACKRARSRISLFEKYCDDSILTMRKILPHMIHNARRAFDRDYVIKLSIYPITNDPEVPWIRNCDAIYWLLSQKANYLHPASSTSYDDDTLPFYCERTNNPLHCHWNCRRPPLPSI